MQEIKDNIQESDQKVQGSVIDKTETEEERLKKKIKALKQIKKQYRKLGMNW